MYFIVLAAPFEAAAQTVFCAEEFAGVYTGEPHSMSGPSGYAAAKTLEAISSKTESGEYERIYVTEGGEEAAVDFFKRSGAEDVRKFSSQNSRGELF